MLGQEPQSRTQGCPPDILGTGLRILARGGDPSGARAHTCAPPATPSRHASVTQRGANPRPDERERGGLSAQQIAAAIADAREGALIRRAALCLARREMKRETGFAYAGDRATARRGRRDKLRLGTDRADVWSEAGVVDQVRVHRVAALSLGDDAMPRAARVYRCRPGALQTTAPADRALLRPRRNKATLCGPPSWPTATT